MTDFLQLLVFFFAAVNPAAAAAAPSPAGRTLPLPLIGVGTVVAIVLVCGVALLSEPILDGLGVEPETFRVGAGVVFLVGGALAAWQGGAPHRGPWEGSLAGVFPLALPVIATPAALAAAVTYGADRGSGETVAAAAIVIAVAAGLLLARAGRYEAAVDGIARATGGLLVVVAAGLIVSGVRAILVALQNRVDPFGRFHAVEARGTMFGNRGGCMHRDKKMVGRPWTNERWICCLLEFQGRHRPEMMAPGLYTELFFLDEATAFAAGHRPCMECRRPDAKRFIEAWSKAHLEPGERVKTISQIDLVAHRERVDPATRAQRTVRSKLDTLPDGVLLTLDDDDPSQPWLIWRSRLHAWTFGGYSRTIPLPLGQTLTLLTPTSFATAFSAGYIPSVHPSARP